VINNIIFDWSGTLSNDLPQVYKTVMKVFIHFGVPTITLDKFRETYTLPYMNHAKMHGVNVSKKELDETFAKYFREAGFPELFPDAKDVLTKLKSMGKKMAVLSSHNQNFLNEEASKFFNGNSEEFFVKLFGNIHDKEEAIESIMKETGFKPSETMIIGDTEHDIETGHRGNLSTAGILTGYCSKDRLESAKPTFIINNLSELLTLNIL
jgi:phosphoglycolate phosphatase